MASVVKRKSSSGKVHYYGKYDAGERTPDGKIVWKMIPTHQPNRGAAHSWINNHEEEEAEKRKNPPAPPADPVSVQICGTLMETWLASLTNRNAKDDRSRARRHMIPQFADRDVRSLETRDALTWIAEMRAGTAKTSTPPKKPRGKRKAKLSDGSMRSNLNLLSRFYSWCIELGHAEVNPVRQVPPKRRPQQAVKTDAPWLDDDALVRKLMDALPAPFDLMFYLGNRSGLRTGEICGLRMADLGFLAEGKVRKRFTYDSGFLKEDKYCRGISKFTSAADDAEAVLAPWMALRKAQGAGPEDLVFPRTEGRCKGKAYDKGSVEDAWDLAAAAVGVAMTWYQATRHSYVSRNLKEGASLDEVSAAVGHSSPVVTRRYYDHFVRETFSDKLRRGLGTKPSEANGKLLPFHGARDGARVENEDDAGKEKSPKPVAASGSCGGGVDGT